MEGNRIPTGRPFVPVRKQNGFAVFGFILSIFTVALWWFPIIGMIFGIYSVIFSILGFRKSVRSGGKIGLALVGAILGFVFLMISFMFTVLAFSSPGITEKGESQEQHVGEDQSNLGEQEQTDPLIQGLFQKEYGFEDKLSLIMVQIGVNSYKITEVEQTSSEDVADFLDYTVYMTADGENDLRAKIHGIFDTLGENREYIYDWQIYNITDANGEKYYYASDSSKYEFDWDSSTYDKSRSRLTIYDYATGEIAERADEEYVQEYQDRMDSYKNKDDEVDDEAGQYIPSNDTEIPYEAEIILMQIAEDIAKQIAQNPGTVDFKSLYWGFAREGTTYAVQGTFECANLLGVTEEHDIQVWCKASDDYSKIQPYAVYLDGEQII